MHAAGVARPGHRARELGRRSHGDALEREVDLEHPRDRLRFLDADLRAGERPVAALEHEPAVAGDRLVARIAGKLDITDGHALLRGGWRADLRGDRLRPARHHEGTERSAQAAPLAPPFHYAFPLRADNHRSPRPRESARPGWKRSPYGSWRR